jgi:KTSC domain
MTSAFRTTNPPLPKPVEPPRPPGKPVEDPPRIDAQDEDQQLINVRVAPSSQIASVMYDPKLLELIIEFQSGAVYKYSQVDQVTVDGFPTADSPGRYFNSAVKGAFEYERLE